MYFLNKTVYSIRSQTHGFFHNFIIILFFYLQSSISNAGSRLSIEGMEVKEERLGLEERVRGLAETTMLKLAGCERLPEEVLAARLAFPGCHGWVRVGRPLQLHSHFILLGCLGQVLGLQGIILCLVGLGQQLCQEVLGQFLDGAERGAKGGMGERGKCSLKIIATQNPVFIVIRMVDVFTRLWGQGAFQKPKSPIECSVSTSLKHSETSGD